MQSFVTNDLNSEPSILAPIVMNYLSHSFSKSCRCLETENWTLPPRSWWIIFRIHSPIREEATLMHWENHSNRCPFSLSFWQYFNIIPIFEIPIMNVDIETIFWCSLEANPCQEIVLIGVFVEGDPFPGNWDNPYIIVEADPFQGIVLIGV